MKTGTEIIRPLLATKNIKGAGIVVLGTAGGDLHHIGTNLVRMMREGARFELLDSSVNSSRTGISRNSKGEKYRYNWFPRSFNYYHTSSEKANRGS